MSTPNLAHDLDALLAVAVHKARQTSLKDGLRKLRAEISGDRPPSKNAAEALDREIPRGVELGEDIIAMRLRERE